MFTQLHYLEWQTNSMFKVFTKHNSVIPPSTSVQQQFNWLTAEDILNAAEDSEYKITHSPIVLIPYEEEDVPKDSFNLDLDLETLPKDVFSNNFAILDNLSSQLLNGNEISPQFNSAERVGCSSLQVFSKLQMCLRAQFNFSYSKFLPSLKFKS